MKTKTYKTTQKQRDVRKAYVLANPEKVAAANAAWRRKNPERKKLLNDRWRQANKAKWNAIVSRWRKANPEKVQLMEKRAWVKHKPKLIAKHKKWKKENPERWTLLNRRSDLLVKYGMTVEQYDEMLKAQGGKCAICEIAKPFGRGNVFSVDHDHETGAVRALLCVKCNTGIGMFRDDYQLIAAASEYVWKHGLRRQLRVA